MTRFHILTVICATFLFVEANINETSPTPGKVFSDYVKETADFIAYSSIKLMVSQDKSNLITNSSTSENSSVGDEIGRIWELIGLVVLVTFLISFIVMPFIIACILCSGGFTGPDSYSALRQSTIGYVENGNTSSKIRTVCALENVLIYFLIGLVIGIPVGIILGVCIWPYL